MQRHHSINLVIFIQEKPKLLSVEAQLLFIDIWNFFLNTNDSNGIFTAQ